jgi:hypothetical protein
MQNHAPRNPVLLNVLVVIVLGTAFCIFFQVTKHVPALARVNPFSDDPYDAVGSFTVQFVPFAILVSLIRIFRPAASPDRIRLQFAAHLMACVAIAFTLIGDLSAMARHVALWSGSRAGYDLLALTLCLLLWTAGAIALLFMTNSVVAPSRPLAIRSIGIPILAAVVLALYPEHVRQTLSGAIVTALCGMLLLVAVIWSVGSVFAPEPVATMPDLLDDVAGLAKLLLERSRLRSPGNAQAARASMAPQSTRLAEPARPPLDPGLPRRHPRRRIPGRTGTRPGIFPARRSQAARHRRLSLSRNRRRSRRLRASRPAAPPGP